MFHNLLGRRRQRKKRYNDGTQEIWKNESRQDRQDFLAYWFGQRAHEDNLDFAPHMKTSQTAFSFVMAALLSNLFDERIMPRWDLLI
jgi:hypothetical protein